MLHQEVVARTTSSAFPLQYAETWAAMYSRVHTSRSDPHGIKSALQHANDTKLASLDRALYLLVLSYVVTGQGPARATAIAGYQPYLNSQDARLALAAVEINSAVWDCTAMPMLRRLALSRNPETVGARYRAYLLVERYLRYGCARSTRTLNQRALDMLPVADPKALAEWAHRRKAWQEENYELVHGHPPPPPMPPKPKMKLERLPHQPPQGPPGQSPLYRP